MKLFEYCTDGTLLEVHDRTLLVVHQRFTQHSTKNSLPEEIRNQHEEFHRVNFGILNTFSELCIFLAGKDAGSHSGC